MLIVKNELSKKGKRYLALILERKEKDLPNVYLSFDRDVICRILGIGIYAYYELLKDENYLNIIC